MHIGDFSLAVGLHPNTVRKLEQRGLIPLPARDYNGLRVYSVEDVQQVKHLLARQHRPDGRKPVRTKAPRAGHGTAAMRLESGG
jgi:hypothetical protein